MGIHHFVICDKHEDKYYNIDCCAMWKYENITKVTANQNIYLFRSHNNNIEGSINES